MNVNVQTTKTQGRRVDMTGSKPNGVSNEAIMAEILRLRAENEALKAKASANDRPISMAIAAKGGVSVYGLGQFPVTLYREQWEKLFTASSQIQSFIKANAKDLATKGVEFVPPTHNPHYKPAKAE